MLRPVLPLTLALQYRTDLQAVHFFNLMLSTSAMPHVRSEAQRNTSLSRLALNQERSNSFPPQKVDSRSKKFHNHHTTSYYLLHTCSRWEYSLSSATMAFVAEGSQAFLSGNDDDDDDTNNFAALDSMTSGRISNQSAFMQQQQQSNSGGGGGGGMNAPASSGGGGGEGGELGESLFDRIRRRTEEQQRQQKAQQQVVAQPATAPTFSQQPPAAQSSFQQQQQQQPPSEFVSQQPSAESSMELGLEREPSDGIIPTNAPTTNTGGNAFATAVQSVENRNINNNNNNSTAENTYSFAASTGEDFSFQPTPGVAAPYVPTYGPSRNDPAYFSGATNNNSQHQYPAASFQDKATMALNDAGSTIKSILEKGMSGASTLVSSAQERMGGGEGGGRGGYSNNFLLREDSMEQGGGNNNNMMHQPPPPQQQQQQQQQMGQSEAVGGESSAVSGQAYSMLSYAKTFCEDLYGFVMQLPPAGKAGVVVVMLVFWFLMRG